VQESVKNTNILRYRYQNPLASSEIREKAKSTFKKYGVDNPLISRDVQESIKSTIKKNTE
jgi:hypothetical protein